MTPRASLPLVLLVAAALGAGACTNQEARGRQLYAGRGCAVCHGVAGRGDGPSVTRLDVRPRDFADVRGYRQGSTQDEIAISIRRGAGPGGAMPAFADISESEAREIAAWIVSLQHGAGAEGKPR